jgi:predicted membrane protein DUF2142
MSRAAPVALVGLAFALLLAAWVVATPPFAAPDEASHYLRALNISQGHLLGAKIRYPNVPLTPAEQAFVNHDTRAVDVPAALTPPNVLCVNGKPDLSGHCVEASPTGDYYPPAYLLPALALKLSSTTGTAMWASRFLSAALCLVFLLLAAALVWGGNGWSLLGLLGAVTPMVLFVSSIINPSGLETAAALAAAAAVLRIARAPARVPGWVWVALGLSGAVTVLAFQAGPAFLLGDMAVGAALLGRSGLRELRARDPRRLGAVAVTLATAVVLWFVYGRVSGASHSHFGVHPFLHSLRVGITQLGYVLRDAVGNFGSLTVLLPSAARWIWWLLVLGLVAGALWLGNRRERLIMVGVVVLALAFPVLAYAWVYRYSGFGMQGRQVLPVLMLISLVAGELVYRRLEVARRPKARWVLGASVAAVALFQAYAWWYDARDAAGAPGTLRFYAHATWSPPLGWIVWIVVAALGTLALLGCGWLTAGVRRPRAPHLIARTTAR